MATWEQQARAHQRHWQAATAAAVLLLATTAATAAAAPPGPLLADAFASWLAFRDPLTGLFCDHLSLPSGPDDAAAPDVCGDNNNRYSSAGTGMGLVMEAAFAEAGLSDKASAKARSMQTIASLSARWPTEDHSGFFIHWTTRAFTVPSGGGGGGFSTIDTAEMALGALFAGNYFGGDCQVAAQALARRISWASAIQSANQPTIFPLINATSGVPSGNIRPYNEYYLVAYLAKELTPGSSGMHGKALAYWSNYFEATTAAPPRGLNGYPVALKTADGKHTLLSDNPRRFMSSFIPQFCFYLARDFATSPFYLQMSREWMQADMQYWSTLINASTVIGGHQVGGRLWGSGAGTTPTGYGVSRIEGPNPDAVASAHIMAGFLPICPPGALRSRLEAQLEWLYANQVCTNEMPLVAPRGRHQSSRRNSSSMPGTSAGAGARILWRCSVSLPEWRPNGVDSIDYATAVLGLASRLLPEGFFASYAL